MSREWSSTKAKRVLAALGRIGWKVKRQTGSHKVLEREGWNDYIFAFRDSEEIGSKMLARIAKKTGLTPEDL
jgi:predicted RNA binding protein YcfA (HicA-like mRNA interferase family)